jgi:hypothetical protein
MDNQGVSTFYKASMMDCLHVLQLNDSTGCSLHDVSPDFIFITFLLCLQVYPLAGVADAVQLNIPRSLNRMVVRSFGYRDNNAILSGDIIRRVKNLAIALDWLNELEELVRQYEQSK